MPTLARLTEATPAEREAYIARLKTIIERADSLEADMLAAAKRMVREAANDLQARWAAVGAGQASEWEEFIQARMQRALAEVARELSARYNVEISEFLPESFLNGIDLTNAGVGAAGVNVGALPGIAPEVVQIASVFPADLITRIDDVTRERVNAEIAKSFMLGDSPANLMQRLARTGLDSGPWKSVAYRTEIIARTELARVQGLGAQKRLAQTHREFPELGLKKVWITAHIREWPCDQCAPLEGTTWDVEDPEAPVAPKHPG